MNTQTATPKTIQKTGQKSDQKIRQKPLEKSLQTGKRRYQMSKRAESAAQTAADIFEATTEIWHENPIGDITLEAIAERANVSVRTIIRRYGSKEGLFESCIKDHSEKMESHRDKARPGDVEDVIRCLLLDYEAHGDAMIRTLAAEEQLEVAGRILKLGREYHRAWCERMFAPFLPEKESEEYTPLLRAFVASTELYLWKLVRRDLGNDVEAVHDTFMKLINGLISTHPKQD